MVSLAQAQAVQKLEAEGWTIIEPANTGMKDARVMMKGRAGGDVVHILVMPNGERSAVPPTDAQIRAW